ncbi:hypothetical protein CP965_12335 [Halarcobacter mediterraneus]|uniref:UspA domain-containing protein n=1 Tax=Halarcobacter mediterraneus TaxID=2023153 RepID=A0A4Q1AVQ1_9BACT|nr:universal stress protein [Halarcobacter mediterraneus]RXK11959.1 hypothetical protein CP965_12335 [Halarcobacter mediterraneus]
MQKTSILVATDFSNNCDKVLNKVLTFAQNKDLELNLIHVVEDSIFNFQDNSEKIKYNCIKFLKENFPQINEKNFYFRVGCIEKEIARLSQDLNCSLIVIGNSGENFSFEKLIMGSTTKKIIRSLDIPTLVIKNTKIIDYKYILVPTDFSEDSKKAVENTFEIFPDSKINLLHVYSVPFESRLNMYGIDKEHAKKYVSNIAKDNLENGNKFIKTFKDIDNKLSLTIENDVLTSEYFRDNSSHWLDGIDLIALHTTGNISFFTFEMLDKSQKDVLIFKK